MSLTDSTLGWGVAGAAALVVLSVLIALLRPRRESGEDSWERSEERRRKKEVVYGTASYVLLFCCAAVAAALSFHGLVGFGIQNLGLSGGWEYLVPFGLDGAAMFCSVLAVREASHGDAAMGSRCLVWLFAAASAWFNWVHAPRGIDHNGAPQFFAGMSLSAAVLFDRALKQTRRAALREQGLVPRPLPQIRIVRWVRAPRETYAAWSLMLLEGVRSLDEAVDEVREDKRERVLNRERQRAEVRRERAEIKAISRQGGGRFGRGQSGAAALTSGSEADGTVVSGHTPNAFGAEREPATAESAIASEALSAEGDSRDKRRAARRRPALVPPLKASGPSRDGLFDLTAEDDTQALPRLDELERKLKGLEQLYG
ncbi:DUF2637 domain-containing protein [Phaeacidiphilus oryzae]|uniref:DUF2637 domain-containing protein n=1 Tax=Phaeacidiphilus oryzae TaxID=348818 RepID=UPI00055B5209|nr:DUF2637 domain-containing protein [Phaeacidiphilus oryzae]